MVAESVQPMTAPGAPDAPMTPEQRARNIVARNPYTCIACGASLPNDDCKKNGVQNACLPAIDNLEADVAQAIREAESSVLRRAADVAQEYALSHAECHGNPASAHNAAMNIRDAIRAIIPSSPSTESDNG